jgi:hypothetical protein
VSASLLAEECDDQVRGAVGYSVLLREVGGAVDEYEKLHHTSDPVQAADFLSKRRERVESCEPGSFLAVVDVEIPSQLPEETASRSSGCVGVSLTVLLQKIL